MNIFINEEDEEKKYFTGTKSILVFIFLLVIFFTLKANNYYKETLDYPELQTDEFKNYFDLLNIRNNFNVFRKKKMIENIFILISIFPFLQKEINITKKNIIYYLLKNLFNINNTDVIKIKRENKKLFSSKFNELINYKWEDLPNRNQTNYIRHILYHFYPEECLQIYEKSLNKNIKYYIDNNKNKISLELINDLMGKN